MIYGGREGKGSAAREREREEGYAVLRYAASFRCLVEEWKDCEELKPKPKAQCLFVYKKWRERNIERSGVLMPASIDVSDVEDVAST